MMEGIGRRRRTVDGERARVRETKTLMRRLYACTCIEAEDFAGEMGLGFENSAFDDCACNFLSFFLTALVFFKFHFFFLFCWFYWGMSA